MKTSNWKNYEKRLQRVTTYIYEHLDDDLDLRKLADIACMSPYHWHRIYHAILGETAVATVKRLRLHRAAGYLAMTNMPIEKVAAKSGYPNLQSFNRIFKSIYGLPPGQYRKQGTHAQYDSQPGDEPMGHYDVEIKTLPALQMVTLNHRGPYMQIGKAFDTLFGMLGSRNLLHAELRSFGIYYDDPNAVPEDALRSKAGVVINNDSTFEPPFESIEIAAGKYAVLRHQGPYADLEAAYRWLYGKWLPPSGEEPADAPCIEEYLNNPRETAPTDLLTDIHLPIL